MSAFIKYFRIHPWQRRALTALTSLLIALIAAVALANPVRDWMLIRSLCGDDLDQREQGLASLRDLMQQAKPPQSLIDRLEEALKTDDDTRFDRVVQALSEAHHFSTPGRDPAQKDRLWSIRLRQTPDPQLRMEMIETTLVAGRQNQYVRKMARLAAADADAGVRLRAALLSASLQDDEGLAGLLGDKEPAVRAAAAVDAGLAGRSALREKIRPLLQDKDDLVAASAAYALAAMGDRQTLDALPELIGRCPSGARLEGLLHALRLGPPEIVARGLDAAFTRAVADKRPPSPLAIVLAGKTKYAGAAGVVKTLLSRAAGRDPGLSEAHVLAALQAVKTLDVPAAADINTILTAYWSPQFELTMIAAAEALGRQIRPGSGGADAGEFGGHESLTCIRTLQMAAAYSPPPAQTQPAQTLPDAAGSQQMTMPLATAAAAAALWQIAPAATYMSNEAPTAEAKQGLSVLKIDRQSSAFYVHLTAGNDSTLAGDYLAWHLARSGKRAQAFETALAMLPPLNAPVYLRVYNPNARAAGAMLLALSAGNDEQKSAAVARIVGRLTGKGREDDPYTAGAYQCALLILGDRNFQEVRRLAQNREFPQRRVLTALLAAGDVRCLDDVLWTPDLTAQDVTYLLINKGIGEVIAALVPALPPVDAVALTVVANWQSQILRDAYLLNRGRLKAGEGR